MRALLQRVAEASVAVGGDEVARIGRGWLILLGIGRGDGQQVANQVAEKVALLRCFEDEAGKTNLSAADVGAEMLVALVNDGPFTIWLDTERDAKSTKA